MPALSWCWSRLDTSGPGVLWTRNWTMHLNGLQFFAKTHGSILQLSNFRRSCSRSTRGYPSPKSYPFDFDIIFLKKNPAKKSQPPFSSHLGNPATHAVVARGMTLRCWGPGWKLNSIQSTFPKLTLGGIRRSKCLMMSRPFQTYIPYRRFYLGSWLFWHCGGYEVYEQS